MLSSPTKSTHGRKTSDVSRNHSPWKTHNVRRHPAWHAIISLGVHKRSDDVIRGMPSSPLNCTQTDDVGIGMPSSPFEITQG